MGSPVQKRIGLVTYPSTSNFPMAPSRDSWALYPVVKDHLWEMADKLPLSGSISFESTDEEDYHHYLTMFIDHIETKRYLISPYTLLRMRIEKDELSLPELRFE